MKNVRQGPAGLIINALQENLSNWTLLGIRFLGGSEFEIVTVAKQNDLLLAIRQMLRIMQNFKF